MSPIVEARGLTKRFGNVEALAGLDIVAESGHVTALLGPNGAGKTTFVSAVATLLRPDDGELRVAGTEATSEPQRVRQVIGLAGQFASVEPAMSGRENLEFVGRLFGLDRREARSAATAVLERIGLTDDANRLVRTYSGGMRRRLDLGASLVGRPRLLLLDEPTAGLDPRSRIDLWDAIRNLVAERTDVLLTTQYLEEADQLARDVVIIDFGHVVAAGDLPAVEDILISVAAESPRVDLDTTRVAVGADGGADQLTVVVRHLDEHGIAVDDIGLRRPSLDEVFLTLTGRAVGTPADQDDPTADAA